MENKDTLFVGCPFGVFGLDGSWKHNPLLKLSEHEQRMHNQYILTQKAQQKAQKLRKDMQWSIFGEDSQ